MCIRDSSYTINKKVRRLALKSALSQKVLDGAIYVIDALEMDEIKTKKFADFLKAIGVDGKAMVVTSAVNENVVLSARNIPGVQTTIATILSAYDVMNAKAFVVDQAALAKIEEVYA